MAIAPAGAMYKSLTFDNKTSREFGVYITGEAVYNAPEREVEMITIPGRSGAFALDKGRFENIPVKYPAGIFAENESDFAQAMSDFRNFLCSKQGYCRLTDDYNPNEFRKAVYKSGLEVEPAQLRAGEFEILFDAMPQRWLTSGETKQTIAASGDTITNPTLFDSKPMIEATGYGTIDWGDGEITISNDPIGTISVLTRAKESGVRSFSFTFRDTYANSGDTLTAQKISYTADFTTTPFTTWSTTESGDVDSIQFTFYSSTHFVVKVSMDNKQWSYGTSETWTGSSSIVLNTVDHGAVTVVVNMTVSYDGADGITVSGTTSYPSQYASETETSYFPYIESSWILLDSTQYAIGAPLYIDLETGEAYKIENGSAVSVNNAVVLPAELPTLKPGSNAITFDNTFAKIEIIPHWWKL